MVLMYAVIVALILLMLLGTVALVFWGELIAGRMQGDVFKLITTLVTSSGIGGIATLLYNALNVQRERREAKHQLVQSTLQDIVRSYNEIKAIRRQLRAEAVRPAYDHLEAFVLATPYAELMRKLNDAQLALETHMRRIEGNKPQYPHPETLLGGLRKAESYVGKLISEWEKGSGFARKKELSAFPVLRSFLSHANQGFKPCFADPIADVLNALGKVLSPSRRLICWSKSVHDGQRAQIPHNTRECNFMDDQTTSEKEKQAIDLWKHFSTFGFNDKNAMMTGENWLLGLQGTIIGYIVTKILCYSDGFHVHVQEPFAGFVISLFGIGIAILAAYVSFLYAGQSNRNWKNADKIAKDHLPSIWQEICVPSPPAKKMAPIFCVYILIAIITGLFDIAIFLLCIFGGASRCPTALISIAQ
ncbi:hypothetical protein AB4Y32_29635 [Paraburkholderia phymatum]|uniref:Uncharacterized protein n=1 Tax=Paraburkholderia phymatum TaxID=148447 RepID=A0ACC6U868_9BURK